MTGFAGRIQRVDAPTPDLLALTVYADGRRVVLLLSVADGAQGVGTVPDRPRGEPSSAFVQKLRKEVGGGAVREVRAAGPRVSVPVARGDASRAIELLGPPGRATIALVDGAGKVLAAMHPDRLRELGGRVGQPLPVSPNETLGPLSAGELAARGAPLLARRAGGLLEARRVALRRRVKAALGRASRKAEAIAGDAARVAEAPALRVRATLLLSNLHAIPDGATSFVATDWEADPPVEVEIHIEPGTSPARAAEALFHRARRLARGAELAGPRLEAGRAEVSALTELLRSVEAASSEEALTSLERRVEVPGGPALPSSRQGRQTGRRPYRSFEGHGGAPILVGRGAVDNDALTVRIARPNDLWLHARGRTGAHVIVPRARGEEVPPELLLDAATLAAHFSDAARDATVEVQHTPRRFLRKPRGAAPGAVIVDREKVLLLRMEPDRVRRLLATERR